MAETVIADLKGICTAPGTVQRAAGTCQTAYNVFFEAPGVMRLRRGVQRQANSVDGPIYGIAKSKAWGDNFLINHGTATAANALSYGNGSALRTALSGTYSNGRLRAMKSASLQANAYLTTDEGLRRIGSHYAEAYAGLPRGLPCESGRQFGRAFAPLTGSGGFLADGCSVAYRVTWHLKDYEGVELSGSPLGRCVVRNKSAGGGEVFGYVAGTARNVNVRILVPKQFGTTSTALTTSYYWKLWRTRSSVAGTSEDDECFQVAEAHLSASDISTGYVDYLDITTDTVLVTGAALSTNAASAVPDYPVLVSGFDGTADEPPGLSRCVAEWMGCLWTAELYSRYSLGATLLTVPADADTFMLDSVTFTWKTTTTAVTDVEIVSGFASTQDNIEASCRNLVDAINRQCSNVWAYYLSGPNGLAGQIYIEGRRLTDTFTASDNGLSGGNKWRPSLKQSDALGAATQDVLTNGLRFSKPGRGDSFPPAHLFEIGPRDATIMALQPYRDRLYVFTDVGTYLVTGSSPADFSVQPFDLSLRLLARDAVAVCDDAVYAWCFEGVAKFDQTGAEIVSTPIEPTVQALLSAATISVVARCAFAVAWRTQHKVVFFYPTTSDISASTGSLNCPEGLVYDTRMNTWSQWRTDSTYTAPGGGARSYGYTCGAVRDSDDLLFLCDWYNTATACYFYKEARALATADYADVDHANKSVPLLPDVTFNFLMPDGGEAVHWQELLLGWDNNSPVAVYATPTQVVNVTFTTEVTNDVETVTPNATQVSRVVVPRAARRGNRLKLRIRQLDTQKATEFFGVNHLALRFLPGTHRVVK